MKQRVWPKSRSRAPPELLGRSVRRTADIICLNFSSSSPDRELNSAYRGPLNLVLDLCGGDLPHTVLPADVCVSNLYESPPSHRRPPEIPPLFSLVIVTSPLGGEAPSIFVRPRFPPPRFVSSSFSQGIVCGPLTPAKPLLFRS